jgi:ParB/RepB/Spo0J family partition protein
MAALMAAIVPCHGSSEKLPGRIGARIVGSMQGLMGQIAQAEGIFERVQAEEQARSELIELADVVQEDRYRGLRTELRDIDQLAGKIAERGQLVPILVWLRRGKYVLLSGHRRVAALEMLGSDTVKAIVYNDRDLSEKDAFDIAVDDNVDRNNFTKVELARLVAQMIEEGMTQRRIAVRLRLGSGTVSDLFRLHSAPADVQAAIDSGRLAVRAGLRLAKESDEVRARVLATDAAGMLSLGDVERLIGGGEETAPAEPKPKKRARRGAAWSRPKVEVTGLAWQRERDGERELKIRLPAEPTDEQRLALRKYLLDQVRAL